MLVTAAVPTWLENGSSLKKSLGCKESLGSPIDNKLMRVEKVALVFGETVSYGDFL